METKAFLYKIWIMNRPDCCLEELPSLQVTLKNIKNSAIAADCQVYDWKVEQRRLLICEPSIMTTNITILADKAESLSLCEVLITATGEKFVRQFDEMIGVKIESEHKGKREKINKLKNENSFKDPFAGVH